MKSNFSAHSTKRNLGMSDKEARDQAAAAKKKKQAVLNVLKEQGDNPPRYKNKGTGDNSQNARKSKDTSNSHTPNKTINANKAKTHSKYANVSHKHSTGGTNWLKFLQENTEGIKRPTVKNTSNTEAMNNFESRRNSLANSSPKLTKVVGMDCEMVGVGDDGRDSILARVSIVNVFGECIYDKYVKPREKVTDYRTYVSGIRAEDIANGEEFKTVQKEVAEILRRRILVGHAIKNDLEVLFLSHPRNNIRDTAKFFRQGGCKTPSLKTLASQYLDVAIQEGEHSSVQDAKAAVQLYNLYRKEWESGGGNRKHNRIDTCHHKIRNQHNRAEDT